MTVVGVGSRLGRYELQAEMGQGGMSVVYRARDLQLLRDVAVKVMHPFLAEQKEGRARFAREAVAVARLRHPHIIAIYDYSDASTEATYIVTELVDGQPLSRLLDQGKLVPPEACLILGRPIIDALRAAHEAGVIHRDLKPENVLVGKSGVLKLTDFGIARILDNQSLTVTGTLLGSPAYMAPEYIEGQPTDERADIFSCGVMFYQMVVGTLPFVGPSPHALLKKIAAGDFIPADQANPHIHAAIARIIHHCLAVHVAERYATASLLLQDLDALLAQLQWDAETELPRLLTDPQGYGAALQAPLVARYVHLGDMALATGHVGQALEHFDRVLSLEPNHPAVRATLKRLSRRTFVLRCAQASAGALLVAGGIFAAQSALLRPPAPSPVPQVVQPTPPEPPAAPLTYELAFTLRGRGDLYLDSTLYRRDAGGALRLPLTAGPHTARFVGEERTDARAFIVSEDGAQPSIHLDARRPETPAPMTEAEPAPALPVEKRAVEFKPAGQWVTLFVDHAPIPAVKEEMRPFKLPFTYGKHHLRFVNDKAQMLEQDLWVSATEPANVTLVRLKPLDAKLRIQGAPDGAVVDVADHRFVLNERTRGDPIFVPLPAGQGFKEFEVVLRSADGSVVYLRQRLVFRPAEEQVLAIPVKPL